MRTKVVLTFFAAWMMCCLSYVTFQVFSDVSQINAAVNAALVTVYGLPALVVAILEIRSRLYKWMEDGV